MASASGGYGPLVRSLLTAAADLILPVCCAVCDRLLASASTDVICGHCWSLVRELPYPRCPRCGHPVTTHSCRWCPNIPAFVRSARSYCWIGAGTGKDIVHALKYDGWTRAAIGIGERMARLSFPPDVVEERGALIPVPLSRARLRERGFNQSECIAQSVALQWGIPVWSSVLIRSSSTRSQTQLTPEERLGNVAGAFSVSALSRTTIAGTHLILIDDVVTTGATLRAAAAALFASGARTISYMTFGRAPASGDRLIP